MILVVMDVFTRRIIGFAVQAVAVDGSPLEYEFATGTSQNRKFDESAKVG